MTAKTTMAPSYRLRAVFAAEKLHRAALDAGDDAKAATVLEVTRLFIPNAQFSESAKPATRLPAKVEATEQPTDLSEDEHLWNTVVFTSEARGGIEPVGEPGTTGGA